MPEAVAGNGEFERQGIAEPFAGFARVEFGPELEEV